MAREELTIVVHADGTQAVKRHFDDIGRAADRATRGMYLFQRAMRTIGFGIIVRELVQLADGFINIKNRLALVTTGTANLNKVTQQLLAISNDTRTSFQTNAELFNRMALASRGFGYSQEELLKVTQTLNKGIIVSGAGVREANNALIQLSQGMASGRLNGDELRSVLEQLPIVADVIAKELGTTRGELRKFGREGKITTEVIIEAIKNAEAEIAGRFSRTIPTISQAFTILRNNIIAVIGEFNDATGSVQTFAKTLQSIALSIGSMAEFIRENQQLVSALTVTIVGLGAAAGLTWGARRLKELYDYTSATVNYYRALSQGAAAANSELLRNRTSERNMSSLSAMASGGAVEKGSNKAKEELARVRSMQAKDNLAAAISNRQLATSYQAVIQQQLAVVATEKTLEQERAKAQISGEGRRMSRERMALVLEKERRGTDALRTASGQLLLAQARETNATKVAIAAESAHAASLARLTVGARLAAGAMTILRGTMAFFGGVPGLIFTAIATAITIWAYNTKEARDVLQDYKDLVDATRGSFQNVQEAIKDMTQAQREQSLGEFNAQMKTLKEQTTEAREEFDRLVNKSTLAGYSSRFLKTLDEDLRNALMGFKDGSVSMDSLRLAAARATGSASETTARLAKLILDAVVKYQELDGAQKDAANSSKSLSDSLAGAGRQLQFNAEALERAERAAKAYSATLASIRAFVPEFKEIDEARGKVQELSDLVKQLKVDTTKLFNSNPTTNALNAPSGIDDAISKHMEEQAKVIEKARDEITDYNKVLEELKKKEDKLFQKNATPRESAIDEILVEYRELNKLIELAADKGLDAAKVLELQEAAATQLGKSLHTVNKEFDQKEKEALKKKDSTKSFETEIKALEDENVLLRVNASEREALTKIMAIEKALEKELDAGQRAKVTTLVEANEQLSLENDLLQEIIGPLQNLAKSQAALNRLLHEGAITAGEFKLKMFELKQTVMDLDAAIAAVRAYDPDLKKIDDAKRDLEELAIKTEIAKEKLRTLFAGMIDQSPNVKLDLDRKLKEIDEDARKAADSIKGIKDVLKELKDADSDAKIGSIEDPKEQALARVREEAKKREEAIRKAFTAEEDQLRLNEALADNERILGAEIANTTRQYEDRANKQKTFESEVQNLIDTNEELRINGTLRSQLIAINNIEKSLKRELTTEEAEFVKLLVEENESLELQRSLYEEIRGPLENFTKSKAALHEMLRSGMITIDEYNQKLIDLELQLLSTDKTVAGGYRRGLLKTQQDITDFASQSEQIVVNAFKGMEDALVSFVTTGKVDFKSLVSSILADLTRLLVRYYIIAPILRALTGTSDLGGGGGGGGGGGILGSLLNSLGGGGGGGGGSSGGSGGGVMGGVTSAVTSAFKSVFSTGGSSSMTSSGMTSIDIPAIGGVLAKSISPAVEQISNVATSFSKTGIGLAKITTSGGLSALVNKAYAKNFQGFINELESTGYKIKSLGGYNYRNIAGTNTLSNHSFGNAIDINPPTNPDTGRGGKLITDMPSNVSDMAKKYGVEWGGDWRSKKDAMHFEMGDKAGSASAALEKLGTTTGSATTMIGGFGAQTIQVSNQLIQAAGGIGQFSSSLKSFLGSITGGGSSWFQGLMGNFGGIGGALNFMNGISPRATAHILGGFGGLFDTGGFTGEGDKKDVAGVVHRGEFVFSKKATDKLGVGVLEKMHNAAMMGKGFSSGGFTGAGGFTGLSTGFTGLDANFMAGFRLPIGHDPSKSRSLYGGTPDDRKATPSPTSAPQGEDTNKVRIINVMDPSVVGDYLSTEEGERIVMNVLRRLGKA